MVREPPSDRVSVAARHADVENNQIGLYFQDGLGSTRAIIRRIDFVAGELQPHGQCRHNFIFVVHHKNSRAKRTLTCGLLQTMSDRSRLSNF